MADIVKNVTNLDIQLLDVNREGTTTIKLDNPKTNVTREQVSAAMQPAFSEGWFISPKTGRTLTYLGDVIVNQSIKTTLGGEDFYVTPSSLNFWNESEGDHYTSLDINVSGATIQGYNITDLAQDAGYNVSVTISNNGLKATVHLSNLNPQSSTTFNVVLIIQGTAITIPCSVPIE